jgi:2-iminobutanoate/2-iminopropanoate deaminase
MDKKIIETTEAPAPIGPYSQAVIANGFLFASGQVAIVPSTGELAIENVEVETKQVMENIRAVLTEANLGFENIIKTTIFLSDMALFARVNEVYSTYFTGNYPARETVAVKGLPKNVNVEISITAVL